MKTTWIILVLSVFQILVYAKKEKDVADVLNDYFKSISEEGALDYVIILTSDQYYEDGSLKQTDTLAFSSAAEDDTLLKNFNLSSLSDTKIKKLVSDAKSNDVQLSLYQESKVGDDYNINSFDTPVMGQVASAAANVVLHPDGFVAGLEEEIADAMDLTENVATIQVLEYFSEGSIKRNTTTSVYSNKVNVVDSYKMPPRMIQTSAELLRKAYKVDMDDRTPFISKLFEKEYATYKWEVLANSTDPLPTKGVAVTLTVGQDKYNILGVLKK